MVYAQAAGLSNRQTLGLGRERIGSVRTSPASNQVVRGRPASAKGGAQPGRSPGGRASGAATGRTAVAPAIPASYGVAKRRARSGGFMATRAFPGDAPLGRAVRIAAEPFTRWIAAARPATVFDDGLRGSLPTWHLSGHLLPVTVWPIAVARGMRRSSPWADTLLTRDLSSGHPSRVGGAEIPQSSRRHRHINHGTDLRGKGGWVAHSPTGLSKRPTFRIDVVDKNDAWP